MSNIKVKIEKRMNGGNAIHIIHSIRGAVEIFGNKRSYTVGDTITDMADLDEIVRRQKYDATIIAVYTPIP